MIYLQNAFAIAILSIIAIIGIAINDEPKLEIIPSKGTVSLPIVVSKGGGLKSGKPDATLPVNANGATPSSVVIAYAIAVPINTANAFRANDV